MDELVRLLGFARVVHGRVRAKTAIVPPPTPCGGHVAGPHAARLRGMLVGALGAPAVDPTKLVLLRRSGARSITNHAAVRKALQGRGWRVTVHTGEEVCSSLPKSYITRHALAPFLPPSALLLGAPRLGFAQ